MIIEGAGISFEAGKKDMVTFRRFPMHLNAKKFSKMSYKVLIRYLLPTCLVVAAEMGEVRDIPFVRNLLLRLSLDRKFQAGTCFSFSFQLLLRSIVVMFKNKHALLETRVSGSLRRQEVWEERRETPTPSFWSETA